MESDVPSGPRPVVLVIDDDPPSRLLARLTLEAEGCRVVEAGSAAEALEAAESHRPPVIVLDYDLGRETTGADLAPLLKARCPGAHIVISSAVLADDSRWREGVEAVVEKTDTARLVRLVAGWLPVGPPHRTSPA